MYIAGWESQTNSCLLRDEPMNSEMHVQKPQRMPRKTLDASKLKLFLTRISPKNCQRLFHDHVLSWEARQTASMLQMNKMEHGKLSPRLSIS